MSFSKKPLEVLKKFRISIITALVFVLVFTAVLLTANFTKPATSAGELVSALDTDLQTSVSVQAPLFSALDVYVDGKAVAKIASDSELTASLNDIINGYTGVTASIVNNVTTDATECEQSQIVLQEELTDILKPLISIQTIALFEEEIELSYNTKYIDSDNYSAGYMHTLQSGVTGSGTQTTKTVAVDGTEVSEAIVKTDVTEEPVDEIILRGIRNDSMQTVSLGVLQRPYEGQITSYFAYRWGKMHTGIDLCGLGHSCKGEPALSAADGIVTFVDTKGGYGKTVIVDHGDGMTTLYAHLMGYNVAVGDVVKAGDVVGFIGDTGVATGYHLHFEVRIDDEPVNPLLFVDYN